MSGAAPEQMSACQLDELCRREIEDITGIDPDAGKLRFTSMGDLLNEPEEQIRWLVEEHLTAGGDSLLVAKPKVGKSTLARCLALAVARGDDFLGSKTAQGTVFYLALEEKRSEVRRHFHAMGARNDDAIRIFCASSPADGLAQLREVIKTEKPVLVIVDPLFRFVRIKDGNDYAAVTNALEPLHALARETGAHVLAVHHLGKGDRQGGDGVLGSTALFAAVDTLLLMKRGEKYRTLSSIQRYGTDLEETTLEYDDERRTLSAGMTRTKADEAEAGKAILEFLATQPEAVEEGTIHEVVEGRKAIMVKALRQAVKDEKITRTGSGKRGDTYHYSVSCSHVPDICEEQTKQTNENDVSDSPQSADVCSRPFADSMHASRTWEPALSPEERETFDV
jgi:AAA domain